MRKLIFSTILLLCSVSLGAQGVAVSVRNGTVDPSTCNPQGLNVFFNRSAVPTVPKLCTDTNTWASITVGGLTQAAADLRYLKLAADNDPLTGALTGVAGTAALPSFSFVGETDTGMFLSAANTIGFSTGGTERWVINSSGAFNCATDGGCDIGNGVADPRDLSLKRNLILRGSTSGKITFAAGATTTDYTYTWPSAAAVSPTTMFLRGDGTWNVAGTGDVVGPASATDGALAIYNGPGGKTIKNSDVVANTASLDLVTAHFIRFGPNYFRMLNATGPCFYDTSPDSRLCINIQSLSANRTLTARDQDGTIAVIGDKLAAFAATTSAELATVLTDESGSGGGFLRATGPTASSPSFTGPVSITSSASVGQCTLNGDAPATCTATVPSTCIPVCTYNSDSMANAIACSVTSTTLTAVSSQSGDVGVVNYHCF